MADRVLAGGKFVALECGGTWPTPMDEPDGGLEYRLRHSRPQTASDELCAASIVSAYRELILMPAKRRNQVIRSLRAAMRPLNGRDER